MKNFATLLEQQKGVTPISENNYIDAANLEKYLEVTNIFISENAKTVIKYLIDHNAEYMMDLGKGVTDVNVLDKFMRSREPQDAEKKAVWEALHALKDQNRLKEVPMYITKAQFDQILTKKIAPDKVFLDFETEQGKNEIVRRYTPLVKKLVSQYLGKSNCNYDDLYSAGMLGMTYAINQYGKRNRSTVDEEVLNSKTFGQFATYQIRVQILEEIKNRSQTVRIAVSAQQAERNRTGSNTRSYTVSGDKRIGSDDENSKTLFDVIGDTSSADRATDEHEIERLWGEVYAELEKHFSKKIIDMFYSKFGLNNKKKLDVKDIATKYGVVSSNVTYYTSKVNRFIQKDPKILNMLRDIYDLMKECQVEWDHDDDLIEEGAHINFNNNTNNNTEDNE